MLDQGKKSAAKHPESITPDFSSARVVIDGFTEASQFGEERWLYNRVVALPTDATLLLFGDVPERFVVAAACACVETDRRVHIVETARGLNNRPGNMTYRALKQGLAKYGLEKYVVFDSPVEFESDSQLTIEKFDLAVLGTSCTKGDAQQNFDAILPCLKRGALLAMCDVVTNRAGAWQAWTDHIQPQLERTGHYFSIAYGCKAAARTASKVHIVIPVFNRKALTRMCLRQAFSQTLIDRITVTVVDDGSTDGTDDMLADEFPTARVIKGDGHLWWTGAVVKALDQLRPSFAENDFFLLVNNDTMLHDETVEILVRESERSGRGCIAPIAIDSGTGEAISTGWGPGSRTILNDFDNLFAAMAQCDGRFEVHTLFGRCSLFPVDILDDVDNYDAAVFPHYFGDADFCLRAREKGFRFFVAGSTCIRVFEEEDATGSHFRFRQGPQSLANVWKNMTAIKSIENVPVTWRYMLRHHRHRAGTNTITVAWRSLRQWTPIYKSLGLGPLPQRGAPAPSKTDSNTQTVKTGSLAQHLGRKSKRVAAAGLEFISFWSLRAAFAAYRLSQSARRAPHDKFG